MRCLFYFDQVNIDTIEVILVKLKTDAFKKITHEKKSFFVKNLYITCRPY